MQGERNYPKGLGSWGGSSTMTARAQPYFTRAGTSSLPCPASVWHLWLVAIQISTPIIGWPSVRLLWCNRIALATDEALCRPSPDIKDRSHQSSEVVFLFFINTHPSLLLLPLLHFNMGWFGSDDSDQAQAYNNVGFNCWSEGYGFIDLSVVQLIRPAWAQGQDLPRAHRRSCRIRGTSSSSSSSGSFSADNIFVTL